MTATGNQNVFGTLVAVVRIATEPLSKQQLADLNLHYYLGGNVKSCDGYEAVKHLFTENNGTGMHSETERAWNIVVIERMKQPN